MKPEDYDKIDDFFDGNLSEKEEKNLRNELDNSFFEVLNEEKKVKMDFSFDEFLSKIDEVDQDQNQEIQPKRKQVKIWSWMGMAASVLIVFGLYFTQKITVEPTNFPLEIVDHLPVVEEDSVKEEIINEVGNELISDDLENINTIAKNEENKQKITNKVVTQKSITEQTESAKEYSSDYVMVNGQPVEDEQEAVELAKSTLKIFSKKMNQGADAIDKLKEMSIEL